MRNPSQVLLLAVLMMSLILPPGLVPVAAATPVAKPHARSILLVGDSLSIDLGQQLEGAFAGRPGPAFAHLGKVSSGLANPAFFDWNANLTAQVKAHHPDVVLVMVGANDDKPLPMAGGRSAAFGTRDWDAAYADRLARLHGIARSENPDAVVYLIGVPVMGDPAFNAKMVHVNGVLARAAAHLPDCAFIDVKDVLADASGAFAPMGRKPDGGLVKLRAPDGVHISRAGSRLLAARCVEAIAGPSGLAKGDLLAALDDGGIRPVSAAAAVKAPTQLAEAATSAAPAASVAPAAAPAKPAVVAQAVTPPRPVAKPVASATPAAAAAVAAAGSYAVADRDTLWSVAKRLGVSPEELAAANPGIDPRRMSIGQQLAVPAGATPAQAQAQAQAGTRASGRLHAVAEGDNLWSVARRYDVTVAALTQANPGVDPARLHIGQQLAIPGRGADAAQVAAGQGYTVTDGDNFWSIAHRLGLDVAELKRANAAVDPQKLQPGQVLALPGGAHAAAGQAEAPTRPESPNPQVGDAGLYPVAKGDTLWALSRRFGVRLDMLLTANGELDPSRLHVGQLVTIPAGKSVATAETIAFPVSSGDTLWGIARRFDVSVEVLLAANPGVDPLRLHEGQTLRVPSSLAAVAASASAKKGAAQDAAPTAAPETTPAPAAANVPARVHTVSGGDTLWDLARHYGVSIERMLHANAGLDPAHLRVGQIVRLPDSVVSMAAR